MSQGRARVLGGEKNPSSMSNQVHAMPSIVMKTFAILADEIGGFQMGAESLGMSCIGQMDWKSEALLVRQPKFATQCDCLAISMPSGARVFGSDTTAGNWIGGEAIVDKIANVVKGMRPKTLVIYARRALLTDRFGTTFGEILKVLHEYSVAWKGVNLSWFDIPQDANRVLVLGRLNDDSVVTSNSWLDVIRDDLPPECLARFTPLPQEELSLLVESRKPLLGRPAPIRANPFGSGGYCVSGTLFSASYPILKRLIYCSQVTESLQLMWDLDKPPDMHSVRFTSRRGEKGLSFKRDGLAHSFGPSISAWPMFAVEVGILDRLHNKAKIVEWRTILDGHDVFRLSPASALGLFGQDALPLGARLDSLKGGSTRKYEIGSSTVPPRVARASFLSLERHLNSDRRRRDLVV